MYKRLTSLLLALIMCFALSVTAFAEENTANYWEMNEESLAALVGTDVADIKNMKEVYGEDFNETIQWYLEATRDLRVNSSRVDVRVSDWSSFSSVTNTGSIILSKDGTFSSYRHGHAALCYINSGSTFDVVEHPGVGQRSVRQGANISFAGATTLASFIPKNATTQQKASAVSYADSNLVGWSYSALASRGSSTYLNCATLVWKAYDAAGVQVCDDDDSTITVIPSQYDDTRYTTRLYANSAYINTSWN